MRAAPSWWRRCPRGSRRRKGLAAPFTYTPQNNTGPVLFRMLSYDYDAKKWKASGEFADSAKYMK